MRSISLIAALIGTFRTRITQYWRYFGVHSYSLGPIKESAPRIVNLNIDEFNMGFDGRFWLGLDN